MIHAQERCSEQNSKELSVLATLDQFVRIPRILRLDIAGQPLNWITWQEAVCLYARELVVWSLGDLALRIYGGICAASGQRSMIDVHSIIACSGRIHAESYSATPPLSNRALFARDRNFCMYCGMKYSDSQLTRDHVVPISRGGTDEWTNVAAACRRCNIHKGDSLLQECELELLALPYAPNVAEYLALTNSGRILGDQLNFLESRFNTMLTERKSFGDEFVNPLPR